ncbi:MAG: AraC family transcriptional regulator [Cyclobacteriaceae bacterium]|nr:AraC family transcriptional regulator [Cyclobacteriaceae bacterium SS2]
MILGLTILSIGIFNGLMLSFVFLNKRMPNPYMGLFIMAHCFLLAKFFDDFIPFNDQFIFLETVADLMGWFIAPLLFFYTKGYLNKRFSHSTHFLFVLILIVGDIIYGNLSMESMQHTFMMSLVIVFQGLIYLGILFKDVKRDKWLSAICSLYFLKLLSILIYQTLPIENNLSHLIIPISIIPMIGYITYKSIVNSNPVVVTSIKKRKNAPIANREVFENIQEIVESTELYLNPNIKLIDLSKELGVSEKTISQAINECTGENVNLFINRYRIKTAERLLIEQSRNITIDAIAELSGFSNKVSFYKAFKKIHAISPKEFIEAKTTEC